MAVLMAHGEYVDLGEAGEAGEAAGKGEGKGAEGEADVIQRAQRCTVITAIMGVIEVVGAGKGVPLPIDVLERTCEGPALTPGEIRPLVTGTTLIGCLKMWGYIRVVLCYGCVTLCTNV